MTQSPAFRLVDIHPSEIAVDPQYQTRIGGLNHGVVAVYAQAMANEASFPPIKVAILDGIPTLLSGAHRLAASLRLERPAIRAALYEVDHSQAIRIAVEDNTRHGLKLTKQESRKAILMFVDARLHRLGRGKVMSSRQLTLEATGGAINHETCLRWLSEDRPEVWASMQRSNTTKKSAQPVNARDIAERRATEAAVGAVRQAAAALKSIRTPERRGKVLEVWQQALATAQKALPFIPPPTLSDDF